MRPLVSGAEAKRYEEPQTDTWLIFPYALDDAGRMRLIPARTMAAHYPKAWSYLRSWEVALRGREAKNRGKPGETHPFDDLEWFRLGRSQNLAKQDGIKLVVAQTVPSMRVCSDSIGDKYLNNVRVNGILSSSAVDMYYVLGALNGPIVDFVFRRIGKPKDGNWFEANKQFIAPLPLPNASEMDRKVVGTQAVSLQESTTRRRNLLAQCVERYAACHHAQRAEEWLWPGLPRQEDLENQAPRKLANRKDRVAWAQKRLEEARAERLAALQAHLDRRTPFEAIYVEGQTRLTAGGAPVAVAFVSEVDGPLVEAYWRWLVLKGTSNDAAAFAAELRRPPSEADAEPARQFVAKVTELATTTRAIAADESALNERLFALYGLSPDERALVLRG